MDVNGAKALKRRLEENGGEEAPRASVHVPEGAPPVYHWFGGGKPATEAPAPPAEDASPARRSWLRRLGLGSR